MVNISKSFPGVKALDKVSISVNKGEVHGLVGENGAGKSTLMKVMSGVYQEDEGEIFIEGKKVEINSVAKAHELGVSIIFQELNLLPHLNVADNIYIGRQPKKGPFVDDKKMHADAQAVLDDLGIDINTYTTVSSLSVAQQQMVEIAKAISMNSRILVLDEPSAALTDKEIDQLFVIIRRLQKKGVGMVYISHRMNELEELCERVTIIRDGQYIDTVKLCDVTMDEVVNMMVGRALEDKYPVYERKIGNVKLEVKNLKQGKKLNIDHLEVRAGEILGISGLVGSGRTETARCIFGADKADSIEVYIDGKKVEIKSVEDAVKHGIGYVTEDRKFDGLALDLDVNYNTNMAHLKHLSKFGFLDDKAGRENSLHYKEQLRIKTPTIKERVRNLSGGNQQKIVLAKWLSNNVDILILDEPTRGIDVGAKYEIYELMNELSDQGVAIIMISSELPEVLGMSDRVAVMHEGSICKILNAKETTQEEVMTYAAGYAQ
ncbi:MAG: sugar ABC transporter ATP-binding protein [Clostridiales bacterium]|nr:sugar ABC transporter ATP-binding protein [Clostridiales bacterium]